MSVLKSYLYVFDILHFFLGNSSSYGTFVNAHVSTPYKFKFKTASEISVNTPQSGCNFVNYFRISVTQSLKSFKCYRLYHRPELLFSL